MFVVNPRESTIKLVILSKLFEMHALFASLSESPTPLRRLRHFVGAEFLYFAFYQH